MTTPKSVPAHFRDSSGKEVTHTPRSAMVLMARALGHLELLPELTREPVRLMLEATIERCAITHNLWGLPFGNVIELAQALVDTAKQAGADDARR
jgi:hypothetical protein